MKTFDPNYKLLDEMYQDDYYPAFLVDKVKDELQKVIDLLEGGETDTEVIQKRWMRRSAASTIFRMNSLKTIARLKRWRGIVLETLWLTFWSGSVSRLIWRRPSENGTGDFYENRAPS